MIALLSGLSGLIEPPLREFVKTNSVRDAPCPIRRYCKESLGTTSVSSLFALFFLVCRTEMIDWYGAILPWVESFEAPLFHGDFHPRAHTTYSTSAFRQHH
jgi:hypothetical protein